MQKRVLFLILFGMLSSRIRCMDYDDIDAWPLFNDTKTLLQPILLPTRSWPVVQVITRPEEVEPRGRLGLAQTLEVPGRSVPIPDRTRQKDADQEEQNVALPSQSKKPKPSLKIKIKLTNPYKPPIEVVKVLNYDPPNAPPRLPVAAPEPQFKVPVVSLHLEPTATSTFYLVRYDNQLVRHLTFCATRRTDLLRQYLVYLLSDPTVPEYTTIRTLLREKFPHTLVKQKGLGYSLDCVEDRCGYTEVQPSSDQLLLKIFEHYLVEHLKESAWYQRINARIAESFEDAIATLKGIKE